MDLAGVNWETLGAVGGPLAVLCLIVWKELKSMNEALVEGLANVAKLMDTSNATRHKTELEQLQILTRLEERQAMVMSQLAGDSVLPLTITKQ